MGFMFLSEVVGMRCLLPTASPLSLSHARYRERLGGLLSRKRALTKHPATLHPDLRLPAFRTAGSKYQLFKQPSLFNVLL